MYDSKDMANEELTKTDIKDAIADLSQIILGVAQDRTPRKGKIAEIRSLRERKTFFEAKLAELS